MKAETIKVVVNDGFDLAPVTCAPFVCLQTMMQMQHLVHQQQQQGSGASASASGDLKAQQRAASLMRLQQGMMRLQQAQAVQASGAFGF